MINFLSKAHQKNLKGIALVRLDFNTADDWRLRAALPTLKFLGARSEKVVIVGHRGRPHALRGDAGGALPLSEKTFSLKADSLRLMKFLRKKVYFVERLDFQKIKEAVCAAPRRSFVFLENIRFFKGETENKSELGKALASLADFYVNEAFAVSHRADASVVAVTNFLPHYAGFGFEREIRSLSAAMESPTHPLVVALGGSKTSDKLGVLKYFRAKADYFLIGGAAANTLLFLKGVNVGVSLIEKDKNSLKKIQSVLRYKNVVLPTDFRWEGGAILDIGEKTAALFASVLGRAKTIIWSGTMGVAERKPFSRGSVAVARAIAANRRAFSVAGGGETVMFLKQHGLDKKFSFISTGGGAMLEFLAGEKLPGIVALEKSKNK